MGRPKRKRSEPDYNAGHEAIEEHLREYKEARKEEEAKESLQSDIELPEGARIEFWYNEHYGWLKATVLKRVQRAVHTLHFDIDGEVEDMMLETWRYRDVSTVDAAVPKELVGSGSGDNLPVVEGELESDDEGDEPAKAPEAEEAMEAEETATPQPQPVNYDSDLNDTSSDEEDWDIDE